MKSLNPINKNRIYSQILIISYITLLSSILTVMFMEYILEWSLNYGRSTKEIYAAFMIIKITLYFLTSVLFIIWFYRAYRNLGNIDIFLQYRNIWAVVGWFIPIMNLFVPRIIMGEIWEKTQIESDNNYITPNTNINIWWGLWIIDNIFSIYLLKIDQYNSNYMSLNLFSDLLSITSIIFTIYVIRTLSGYETDLFNKYETYVNSDEFQELVHQNKED